MRSEQSGEQSSEQRKEEREREREVEAHGRRESEVKAKVGHEEEGERTTREKCIEEDVNPVHANDESHVSNRHMT